MEALEIVKETTMKSDAVCVNGKPRVHMINVNLKAFNRRYNDAMYYFYKWDQSAKPIKADYKRSMDCLNRAYGSMKDILHQEMLIDAPTMNDRDKSEWNDLYWAMPHNLGQLGDRVMNMLKESDYSNFCEVFGRLRKVRLTWKNKEVA